MVRFSVWVGEVPGSIPGRARFASTKEGWDALKNTASQDGPRDLIVAIRPAPFLAHRIQRVYEWAHEYDS